jgi:putative PEP-CTERM system histidine kinase
VFILGFLLAGTGLNLALGFLVQFKSYQRHLRLTLLGLSLLFTAEIWLGHAAVFASSTKQWFLLQRALLAVVLLIALLMLALTRYFLRDGEEDAIVRGRVRMSVFTLAGAGTVMGALACFLPGYLVSPSPNQQQIFFNGPAIVIPTIVTLVAIYTLYLLESTYRFAQDYQRRIGRLCFIGLGVLSLFHIWYFARMVLYRDLPAHFAEASSVVYGVVFPVVLAGFLRYRLGLERISIPRDTVYTSATVFLTGAAFLGVALTVFVFRWLRIDFSYFERFLVGFSLCFLALLVMGSGTMRRRVTRFINHQLYSRKYDYQDQFFRLHKSMMSGSDVDAALTELVENMKYSVTVDDAYFFILNWQDGNFYQHENKEEATRRGLSISGDSRLVRMLASEGKPVDLLDDSPGGRAARATAHAEPLVDEQKFDAVFPIFIGEGAQGTRLVGILALQGGRTRAFDQEDQELIAVFTNSIGNALFRNRVLRERIEQKQFESFHHVASFIIHDIKNQVATLNLVLKNAERNIGNPAFQASMLTSVKSSAVNLQGLIDRLAVAPRRQELELAVHSLRPLLDEVAANSGLGAGLELRGADAEASMDRQALFFVVRNLVNNAVEAMGGRPQASGKLTIAYGPLGGAAPGNAEVTPRLRGLFGGGEQFFAGFGAFIMVEDTGPGMDRDFVRRRLFQPFATTKEKGVGIGLYQCKTLIEKMGGRILCHSELGKGTEFCLLLPAAKHSGPKSGS